MKTEKEKMLDGESYNCGDSKLLERWHRAKDLEKEYREIDTRDLEGRSRILDELLGAKGEGTWIAPPLFVDYGENIYLGRYVEVNMNCTFLDCNRITVGDHTGIGPGVQIFAVGHPVKGSERLSEPDDEHEFCFWKSVTAPVTIGRNVWIGGGSIILPGVTIGDNTTIGAGSVVTRSIPANVLAAGNPCRVIRELGE